MAKQREVLGQATASSALFEPGLGLPFGEGTIVQVEPFQCSTSVWECVAAGGLQLCQPAAKQSDALAQLTLTSRSSIRSGLTCSEGWGVLIVAHDDPSHASIIDWSGV